MAAGLSSFIRKRKSNFSLNRAATEHSKVRILATPAAYPQDTTGQTTTVRRSSSLRRVGSKLVAVLRRRTSTLPDIILTPASPIPYDPRDDLPRENLGSLAPPIRRSLKHNGTPAPALDQLWPSVSITITEIDPPGPDLIDRRPTSAPPPTLDGLRTSTSTSGVDIETPQSIPSVDGEDEPRDDPFPVRESGHRNQELRLSKSSPALAQQLTHRIPTVVNPQDTIVHRPKLATRPTVVPNDLVQNAYHPEPPFGLNDGNSSSFQNGTSVPRSSNKSTPATSASTAPTSASSFGHGTGNPWQAPSALSGVVGLPPIPESSPKVLGFPITEHWEPASVSIATAEATSAAKVFLETYFNTLLASPISPRSQRRRRLEERLFMLPLSSEERQETRRRWRQAESDNLRLARALSSKSGKRGKRPTDHYEVVRVLGKGSFGVVRLVREKPHRLMLQSPTDERGPMNEVELAEEIRHRNQYGGLSMAQRQVYAMKVIRKSDMLRNSQEGHIRAERDFLIASSHSRWVVPLIASFQDHNHLYLVMEYMVGGDFLGLLLREDILPELVARWYVAEMILCVEEAHKMKWVHRDVKPDNFLISASGHLKISDFGLAFDGHWSHHQQYYNSTRESLVDLLGIPVTGDQKDVEDEMQHQAAQNQAKAAYGTTATQHSLGSDRHGTPYRPEGDFVLDKLNSTGKRRLAKSIVGTSQYMAPEVIQGEYYDGRCDWWSIGIILYECLYGSTPFYCEDRENTKTKILKHRQFLHFPNRVRYNQPQTIASQRLPPVTEDAIDLISRLITDREKRISCPAYRHNDLQQRGRSGRHSRCPSRGAFFIYHNDAEEIKSHPFFYGIDWETVHLSKPPWTPRIREGQGIAKYFEDESQILTSTNPSPSTTDEDGAVIKRPVNPTPPASPPIEVPSTAVPLRRSSQRVNNNIGGRRSLGSTFMPSVHPSRLQHILMDHLAELKALLPSGNGQANGAGHHPSPQRLSNSTAASKRSSSPKQTAATAADGPLPAASADIAVPTTPPATPGCPATPSNLNPLAPEHTPASAPQGAIAEPKAPKRRKPKKRPRDKILRDPEVCRQAMEVRKRAAFLGYTYRRCEIPGFEELGVESGRVARGSVWGIPGVGEAIMKGVV